jgi:GNAT superfamily N-acetyltransferase
MKIRQATLEDLDTIIRMRMAFLCEAQSDGSDSAELVEEASRAYFSERMASGELFVWLAEENGEVVGTSGLEFFHKPPTFHNTASLQAYVHSMYTLPNWRGRGIARSLLQQIIQYVRTTPSRCIYLHASEMGFPVYRKVGFVLTRDEMVYRIGE